MLHAGVEACLSLEQDVARKSRKFQGGHSPTRTKQTNVSFLFNENKKNNKRYLSQQTQMSLRRISNVENGFSAQYKYTKS